MENEYMKRGFLLPKGCKDLSDAAKLKQMPKALLWHLPAKLTFYNPVTKSYKQFLPPLPPIKRQVFIPRNTTVMKLAALLDQKPAHIIGDLMKLGAFVNGDEVLDFKIVAIIAQMHGFEVIEAG